MENFISGKDSRDLHDIIAPLAAEQPYRDSKGRRCTCHSTGDSGFSGSIKPDDIDQDGKGLLDGTLDIFYSLLFENHETSFPRSSRSGRGTSRRPGNVTRLGLGLVKLQMIGSNPVEVLNFFFRFLTQLHKLRSQPLRSFFI